MRAEIFIGMTRPRRNRSGLFILRVVGDSSWLRRIKRAASDYLLSFCPSSPHRFSNDPFALRGIEAPKDEGRFCSDLCSSPPATYRCFPAQTKGPRRAALSKTCCSASHRFPRDVRRFPRCYRRKAQSTNPPFSQSLSPPPPPFLRVMNRNDHSSLAWPRASIDRGSSP